MLTLYIVLALAGLPVLMGFAINISTDVLNINDKSKLPSPDFGNDSPYLFTPMYEASFKGTKR